MAPLSDSSAFFNRPDVFHSLALRLLNHQIGNPFPTPSPQAPYHPTPLTLHVAHSLVALLIPDIFKMISSDETRASAQTQLGLPHHRQLDRRQSTLPVSLLILSPPPPPTPPPAPTTPPPPPVAALPEGGVGHLFPISTPARSHTMSSRFALFLLATLLALVLRSVALAGGGG